MHELIDLLGYMGLSRTSSLIIIVLLSERNYLSLTELSRRTGYAKSHLSMYLRTLIAQKLVIREYIGRRVVFGINRDGLINYLKNYFTNLRYLLKSSLKNISDIELKLFLEKMYEKLSIVLSELEG